MRLLERFLTWRAERRHVAHQRRLRKMRVIMPKPDPRCVVPNLKEHNSWR